MPHQGDLLRQLLAHAAIAALPLFGPLAYNVKSERDFARDNPKFREKTALKLWAYAAKRPRLYHALSGAAVKLLALLAGRSGKLSWLPFAGAWTRNRDLPAPEGETFHQLYAKRTQE